MNRGSSPKGILVYYVFDLLMLDSKDLRALPLIKRKTLLERLLKPHPRLNYVDHVQGHGLAMFAGALALGVEGIVAKDTAEPLHRRTNTNWHWQKIKNKEYKRHGKVEFRQSGARK